MKTFTTSTRIRATPERVWAILMDASGYPSWDPAFAKIDGQIALGETITLHHREMQPKVLPMKITALEPNRRMVWTGGGMPAAVFKGEHIYELTPCDGPAVELSMRVEFSGLMASMITKSIPDLQPHLEQTAAALKRRAEGA